MGLEQSFGPVHRWEPTNRMLRDYCKHQVSLEAKVKREVSDLLC